MDHASLGNLLGVLLTVAWLVPLAAFTIEVLAGKHLRQFASYLAIGAIGSSCVLSIVALVIWLASPGGKPLFPDEGHGHGQAEAQTEAYERAATDASHAADAEPVELMEPFTGTLYHLARFGNLELSISYYIDSLTLVMFVMVTFVATLIHIYSVGYMHEELEVFVDPEVKTAAGEPLHRPGRFPRFFTYLSLFCFSMLGLVLAGNIFQVFVFWELVGLCSYLLIGFYFERHSASTAANKAFIVNRVGDFGFIIGLMILWSTLGTFSFFDTATGPGLFSKVRPEAGGPLVVPEGMTYTLLVAAGLGIFCGCVGKSAQFPLHVWLPDAMEGPTPVSALIHAATMVAAGVYLVGRFYPMFPPEVLLVIAYVGGITLFMAATIAIAATDIKRVLAYSTVSQLGYMMLGLGLGGWAAGLFHLITHAFFKALLFLCSGSVIHAAHTNEMPSMGGLRRKMPITCLTTLAGVIAITGLAIPIVNVGFAGFYSKDAILAHSLAFVGMTGEAPALLNGKHYLLFLLPLVGAGLTSFYMFRLFFMTFTGEPRDHHVYDHAHESPKTMWVPLAILATCSIFVAWPGESGPLYRLLDYSRPVPHAVHAAGTGTAGLAYPALSHVHAAHHTAGTLALILAAAGTVLAYLFYGIRVLSAEEVGRQFQALHQLLVRKWWFDELYEVLWVRPTHRLAAWCRRFDLKVIDGVVDGSARLTVWTSRWDGRFDLGIVDGLVNLVADWIYATGAWLRVVQTGNVRQYVMFIVIATVGIFAFATYLAR